MKRINYKKLSLQFILLTIAVFISDIGFYFFFMPSKIVGGGIGGIAIICEPFLKTINMSTGVFLYILEAICLLLALIFVGFEFFIKSIYASILAPTFIFIFEITNITPDFFYKTLENKYLIATILGAGLQGIGVGLALLLNASTGGADVIQKILNKYLKIPFSTTMYTTDLIIVTLSGISFTSKVFKLEFIFFGLISVFLCSFIVDAITLNTLGRKTAYILTTKEEEIKIFLKDRFNRNSTSLHVKIDESQKEYTLIICVLKKLEAYKVREEVLKLDSESFTYFTPTKEISGKFDERSILSKIFKKEN